MRLEEPSFAEAALAGRDVSVVDQEVLKVKFRVQMGVMERLDFLQKPTATDDIAALPMTEEQIQDAFARWEKFRFGPRFHNVFMRLYNGYYDDGTREKVAPLRDEQKLIDTITSVLREPPEVFQSRYEDTSHSGLHM